MFLKNIKQDSNRKTCFVDGEKLNIKKGHPFQINI